MSAFAPRYARAFADVVLDNKLDVAQIRQQLEDISETLAGSHDLRAALTNPAIPLVKRVAVLSAISERMGANPKVRNFLAVLTEHGRLKSLDEILVQYRLEMNRRASISEAEVTSARKLNDQERADMEKQAATLAGNAVQASFREDASLIGGVILRIGSTVYDGSVRGRLDRLKDELVASQ